MWLERVALLESKVSELSNLTNDGTEGKDDQLEILIHLLFCRAQNLSSISLVEANKVYSLCARRRNPKGAELPNNSPAFRELDLIEELIESTGTPAVSVIYKRLSKITEAIVEESRKKQGASASALKPRRIQKYFRSCL